MQFQLIAILNSVKKELVEKAGLKILWSIYTKEKIEHHIVFIVK